MNDVAATSTHWLAGFIDGEGYFGILRLRRGEATCWTLRFTLKLRDDDRPILEECAARTGLGVVRAAKANPAGNGRPQAHWTIQNRADCLVLAALLDRYPLRSKKARDFAVWRRALAEWDNGTTGHRWTGQRDWSHIAALRDELDVVRAYG